MTCSQMSISYFMDICSLLCAHYTVWKRNAGQLLHFAFPYSQRFHREVIYQNLMGLELRYFLTMSATLKVIACSNSRRSSPVILRILSRR